MNKKYWLEAGFLWGLILAILTWLNCTEPAYPDNPCTRFTQYLQSKYPDLQGVSGTGPTCRLDFAPGTPQAEIDAASAERAIYDFSVKADPAPRNFLLDCAGDTAIPGGALAHLVMLYDLYQLRPVAAQNLWTRVKGGLAPAVVTAIQSHATANNMTLP